MISPASANCRAAASSRRRARPGRLRPASAEAASSNSSAAVAGAPRAAAARAASSSSCATGGGRPGSGERPVPGLFLRQPDDARRGRVQLPLAAGGMAPATVEASSGCANRSRLALLSSTPGSTAASSAAPPAPLPGTCSAGASGITATSRSASMTSGAGAPQPLADQLAEGLRHWQRPSATAGTPRRTRARPISSAMKGLPPDAASIRRSAGRENDAPSRARSIRCSAPKLSPPTGSTSADSLRTGQLERQFDARPGGALRAEQPDPFAVQAADGEPDGRRARPHPATAHRR